MIRAPFPAEWNTSQLPGNRRAYLESGILFEDLASRLITESHVMHVKLKRYRDPAPGEPKDARQVVFLIRVGDETTLDLLYNAPDGLRGRYWQSPDHGFMATRHLIGKLLPALISFADENPPTPIGKAAPMAAKDIGASLEAPSAKVWPQERDDNGAWLFAADQLMVTRWRENEDHAPTKDMWRQTPRGGELEIKGALLGPDTTEYIPEGKRDRSCQIHRLGHLV
jgi:hypothetical protein